MRAGRGLRLGPIALRPFWRLVFRVAAELENIPLGQTKVLEDHPGRMRQCMGFHTEQFLWHVFNSIVKAGVRAAAAQQIKHMLAKLLAVRVLDFHFSISIPSLLSTRDYDNNQRSGRTSRA